MSLNMYIPSGEVIVRRTLLTLCVQSDTAVHVGGDKGEAKQAPRTNGRNVNEWNRRMLYDAKRMIYNEAPALSLTAVTPDLPALNTQGMPTWLPMRAQ